MQRFENGFEVHELTIASGNAPIAKAGKRVSMKYKGWLDSGKVFDETKGNSKFTFRLGVGEVIAGWD